jgi:predicted nucleotidyltransferase component of viral defense system
MQYPSILGMPVPQLRAYSKESTVAEKLEAMVRFGTMNSRMKDFWDIRNLSRQFDFNGKTLARAIVETFRKRRTVIPVEPVALSSAFAADERKQTQWKAFLRKNRLDNDPDNFAEAVRDVSLFMKPIVEHLADNQPFTAAWKAPGPWREKQKESGIG